MFFASEKEYDFLKKETAEIRDCITKYVGYIIGVTGVSTLLVKYANVPEEITGGTVNMIFVLTTMLVLTLLFEVIWYKFKSHNRHVGYITLLSQEMGGYDLKTIDEMSMKKKAYLDNDNTPITKERLGSENIFSWEFIMSRYNGAKFGGDPARILKATQKAKYVFSLPGLYKYNVLHNDVFMDLDTDFFNKILYPIYGKTTKVKGVFSAFIFLFKWVCKVLKTFYLLLSGGTKFRSIQLDVNIDDKYNPGSGWSYSTKVTQIAFLAFLLLLSFLIFLFIKSGYIVEHKILMSLGGVLFIIWCNRYLIGLHELHAGRNSIEYYCWVFFVFRVQLLNQYGVVPKYFSRSFIRYFKSRVIEEMIREHDGKSLESFKLLKKTACTCGKLHGLESRDLELMQEEGDKKEDKIFFCNLCTRNYLSQLKNHEKFDPKFLDAHKVLINKVKERVRQKLQK